MSFNKALQVILNKLKYHVLNKLALLILGVEEILI